eukprot:424136-Rhodomonas_salina.2
MPGTAIRMVLRYPVLPCAKAGTAIAYGAMMRGSEIASRLVPSAQAQRGPERADAVLRERMLLSGGDPRFARASRIPGRNPYLPTRYAVLRWRYGGMNCVYCGTETLHGCVRYAVLRT